MRKIIILSLLFFTIFLFAGNAPVDIQKEFDQRFPEASEVSWERMSSKGWIAEFLWNGQNCIVKYSFSNAWVETTTQIPISELPPAVNETVTSFYPDWKIVVASKIENAKNEMSFKVAIQSESKLQELVLKPEGTLLMVGIE